MIVKHYHCALQAAPSFYSVKMFQTCQVTTLRRTLPAKKPVRLKCSVCLLSSSGRGSEQSNQELLHSAELNTGSIRDDEGAKKSRGSCLIVCIK